MATWLHFNISTILFSLHFTVAALKSWDWQEDCVNNWEIAFSIWKGLHKHLPAGRGLLYISRLYMYYDSSANIDWAVMVQITYSVHISTYYFGNALVVWNLVLYTKICGIHGKSQRFYQVFLWNSLIYLLYLYQPLEYYHCLYLSNPNPTCRGFDQL